MQEEIKQEFLKRLESTVYEAEMKLGFYKSEVEKAESDEAKAKGQVQIDALQQDLEMKQDYLKYVKSN